MAQTSQSTGIAFGVMIAAIGAALMAIMAISPGGLNVPPWVAQIAASTFVFAGLSFVARSMHWLRLQRLCSVLVVYCLAVPGLWIMLGPDTGSCSGTLGFFSRTAGNMECRIVFGIGGVLTLGAAIIMTIIALRKPIDASGK